MDTDSIRKREVF